MAKKDQTPWENFLDPAVLRQNLIRASIYIAAFEVLKNTIVGRLRSFCKYGLEPTGSKYQSEVLARNRSPVHASLDWLKEERAIDRNDLAVFEEVKQLRNELAHELTRMLRTGLPATLPKRFGEMVSLLEKIERWGLEGEAVDAENAIPGPLIGLRLLVEVALGSEEEVRRYIDEFRKRAIHLGSENPS